MKIVTKNHLLVGTAMLTLMSAGLVGCNDFLANNATPQGTLDEGTLATKSGVEGTLVAAYRALDCPAAGGSWGCAASNWVWGSVAGDDSFKGSTSSDQPPINDIEGYHWGAPNGQDYINEKWTISYEGVSRANAAIRLLRKVVTASPSEIADADAKSIEGEAIFLRAHYHFEAYRMWGNIPYYREGDTDFRKANLSAAAVPAEIIKDLDAAIALLPTTPRKNQVGRVTQWTAKAYKGRVQVYAGLYAAALTTLHEVQASGIYALEDSYDRVWTGFKAFENGKETILAYQASANDGEPNGNNANFGERLNFPHSGSPLSCCGFHQGSQNLVNFFKTDAAGLPLALSDPANWNSDNQDLRAAVTGNMNFDPRLDWTPGRNGVPFKDWGAHDSTWIRNIPNGGTYSAKKNVHEKASGAQSSVGWVNTQLNSVNIHILRYADILLLLAEAEVQTGDLANAMIHTNMVRTRAAAKAQGPGTSSAN